MDTQFPHLSNINRGFAPNHQRPHDPVPLRVHTLYRIVNMAPRIATLQDCTESNELPSPFVYPDLHVSIGHEYVPSFSYKGGRPHPCEATILYRVQAVVISDRLITSKLVLCPVAYCLDSFTVRSVPGRTQIFEIRSINEWARPDKVIFHETCPPLGN